MRFAENDILDIMLSKKVSVKKYLELEKKKDKQGIAEFIHDRFVERYIDPLEKSRAKNGFSIAAVCCLMIEALESFHRGWSDTKGRGMGELAFCNFFKRSQSFEDLERYSSDFYQHVRCGVLHQAETTGGWRITRKQGSPLFDHENRTINAEELLKALKGHLSEYRRKLNAEDWKSEIWRNLRKKIHTVITHCKRIESDG